jgi:hypothetical protein
MSVAKMNELKRSIEEFDTQPLTKRNFNEGKED